MTKLQTRPFQQEARHRINADLNSGRNPVFVSPTGTGKTFTACEVIKDRVNLGERVFVLTPQEEIFQQWLLECEKHKISYGFINQSGVNGRNKKVYICMPLSLNNLLSVLPDYFKPDLIITDEAHHSQADTWQNIYNYYSKSKRLGLTATPQRTDGRGLDSTYDTIVQTIEMPEAINSDPPYLAKPLIIVPEQYKLKVPIQNGEYDPRKQAEQLGKTQIIGDIISRYTDIFAGLPVLVACSTFEHAKIMTAEFRKAGWKFEHIHSRLASADRRGMLRGIKNGDLNGLCTVGIGIEGMDIPGLYGLIWLRRTLSITVYLQFIGRVLRPSEGKIYGTILDPVGNVFIHGSPELRRKWTLQGRNSGSGEPEAIAPKMKICPVCSVMNATVNILCHICSHDFRTEPLAGRGRKLPRIIDGKLVVFDADELSEEREKIRENLKKQRDRHNAEKTGEGSGIDSTEANEAEPSAGHAGGSRITQADKLELLKTGLEKKKGLFAEAVKNYL